jgi:hypothetical protein
MFNFNKKDETCAGYNLDYLFIAELADGTIYKQSPDDKARFTVGSSFSDIVDKPIRCFSLVGKGHMFTLDLLSGYLEADGKKLSSPIEVPYGVGLKLIYYRTIQRSIVTAGKTLEPKVKYVIGWEFNIGGKNRKWEVGVE